MRERSSLGEGEGRPHSTMTRTQWNARLSLGTLGEGRPHSTCDDHNKYQTVIRHDQTSCFWNIAQETLAWALESDRSAKVTVDLIIDDSVLATGPVPVVATFGN